MMSLNTIAGCCLQLIGYATGIVGFLATFFVGAKFITNPSLLVLVGVTIAFVGLMIVSWWVGRILDINHLRRYSILQAAITTALLYVGIQLFLFQPLVPESEQYSRIEQGKIDYWELSTGSRVAVRKINANGTADKAPIIFLHGGPGAYSVSLTQTWQAIAKLNQDGRDVYFYDQIGGGLSDHLSDISEYTLDRHISDLKEVYRRVDAEQIVLIGSSFGATLAANYIAQYPEDVSHVIFSGAGPMYLPDWKEGQDGSLDDALTVEEKDAFNKSVNQPRLIAAIILSTINPKTASRFLPSHEAGSFFDKIANDHYMPLTVCNPDNVSTVTSGYGFWSNRMTVQSLRDNIRDPKVALQKNDIPALVLRGVCDYKAEAVAKEYQSVFSNSSYITYENAGHMIYWEKPEAVVHDIRAFLNTKSEEVVH